MYHLCECARVYANMCACVIARARAYAGVHAQRQAAVVELKGKHYSTESEMYLPHLKPGVECPKILLRKAQRKKKRQGREVLGASFPGGSGGRDLLPEITQGFFELPVQTKPRFNHAVLSSSIYIYIYILRFCMENNRHQCHPDPGACDAWTEASRALGSYAHRNNSRFVHVHVNIFFWQHAQRSFTRLSHSS
jgi:hypothetical protein